MRPTSTPHGPPRRYRGTLKKYYKSGPLVKGAGSGTEPLRLGGGIGVSSSNGDLPFVTLSARKRIALLEGDDTLLTAKARVDFEPSGGQVRGMVIVIVPLCGAWLVPLWLVTRGGPKGRQTQATTEACEMKGG